MTAFRAATKFSQDFRALGVLQAHCTALHMHYIAVIYIAAMYAVTFNAYQAVVEGSFRGLVLALAITFGHVQYRKINRIPLPKWRDSSKELCVQDLICWE